MGLGHEQIGLDGLCAWLFLSTDKFGQPVAALVGKGSVVETPSGRVVVPPRL